LLSFFFSFLVQQPFFFFALLHVSHLSFLILFFLSWPSSSFSVLQEIEEGLGFFGNLGSSLGCSLGRTTVLDSRGSDGVALWFFHGWAEKRRSRDWAVHWADLVFLYFLFCPLSFCRFW
jgi:hypothetical protein